MFSILNLFDISSRTVQHLNSETNKRIVKALVRRVMHPTSRSFATTDHYLMCQASFLDATIPVHYICIQGELCTTVYNITILQIILNTTQTAVR